jgi:hypothetical protein
MVTHSERISCSAAPTPRPAVRLLLAAIGDDGVGQVWDRLSRDGRQVLRLAFVEARELGHPCLAETPNGASPRPAEAWRLVAVGWEGSGRGA